MNLNPTPGPDLRRTRRAKPAAQNGNGSSHTDRLPPHSPECEQGVLACALLSGRDVMPICIAQLREGPETFYDLRHQTIYQTLLELYDDNDPIDVITVQQRLKDWGTLEQCGGIAYLSDLPNVVPNATVVESYIETVREKYLLRRAISINTENVGRLYECEAEAEATLDRFETDVLQLSQARTVGEVRDTPTLVRTAIQQIEDIHERRGAISGLETGLIDLDRLTDGLHAGEMIVIAARPSVGKTSLAMNIAEHISVDLHLPVGVFSLEMTSEALMMRMIFTRARVNGRNVREGFLAERDIPRITGAAGAISRSPIYIDDTSSIPIMQLRAKARVWKQRHDIRLLVVDYLGLIDPGKGNKNENREQEVRRISAGLKSLAKELRIPVIVACQLNRTIEREKNREPRLSDLRESGTIEQDADVVAFLYRPRINDDDDGAPSSNHSESSVPVTLYVAKQRNGPVGDIPLTFIKHWTKFESAARAGDDAADTAADAADDQQQQFPDP